jgi:hypothetical protein
MSGVRGYEAMAALGCAAAKAVQVEQSRSLASAFMVDALADGAMSQILPQHWQAAMADASSEAVRGLYNTERGEKEREREGKRER